MKLLTDQNLPEDENDFFESLRLYFPNVYDVKVSHKYIYQFILKSSGMNRHFM